MMNSSNNGSAGHERTPLLPRSRSGLTSRAIGLATINAADDSDDEVTPGLAESGREDKRPLRAKEQAYYAAISAIDMLNCAFNGQAPLQLVALILSGYQEQYLASIAGINIGAAITSLAMLGIVIEKLRTKRNGMSKEEYGKRIKLLYDISDSICSAANMAFFFIPFSMASYSAYQAYMRNDPCQRIGGSYLDYWSLLLPNLAVSLAYPLLKVVGKKNKQAEESESASRGRVKRAANMLCNGFEVLEAATSGVFVERAIIEELPCNPRFMVNENVDGIVNHYDVMTLYCFNLLVAIGIKVLNYRRPATSEWSERLISLLCSAAYIISSMTVDNIGTLCPALCASPAPTIQSTPAVTALASPTPAFFSPVSPTPGLVTTDSPKALTQGEIALGVMIAACIIITFGASAAAFKWRATTKKVNHAPVNNDAAFAEIESASVFASSQSVAAPLVASSSNQGVGSSVFFGSSGLRTTKSSSEICGKVDRPKHVRFASLP